MFLYMLATAAGLSALFMAVPMAYDAVRWAGAAYLLWLAYKMVAKPPSSLTTSALAPETPATLYRRGLLTCLLNPKIVITYGALLPQFVQPSAGHVLWQTVALGLVQIVAAACAHTLVILAAASITAALSKHRSFAAAQRYLLGTVLAGLAFRLATERLSIPAT
jgi:threonine/homoserine/homoserine lactone efflux protein